MENFLGLIEAQKEEIERILFLLKDAYEVCDDVASKLAQDEDVTVARVQEIEKVEIIKSSAIQEFCGILTKLTSTCPKFEPFLSSSEVETTPSHDPEDNPKETPEVTDQSTEISNEELVLLKAANAEDKWVQVNEKRYNIQNKHIYDLTIETIHFLEEKVNELTDNLQKKEDKFAEERELHEEALEEIQRRNESLLYHMHKVNCKNKTLERKVRNVLRKSKAMVADHADQTTELMADLHFLFESGLLNVDPEVKRKLQTELFKSVKIHLNEVKENNFLSNRQKPETLHARRCRCRNANMGDVLEKISEELQEVLD